MDNVIGISEAASKKRGRPRVVSEVFRNFCREHHQHVRTERGRQNVKYAAQKSR